MKFLIPIDRASIKENPNKDGKYYIPGRVNKEYDENRNLTSVTQDITVVYDIAPTKWLYKYTDTPIMCSTCLTIFNHTMLKEQWLGDCYFDRICYNCGDLYCCELEFEKLPADFVLHPAEGS